MNRVAIQKSSLRRSLFLLAFSIFIGGSNVIGQKTASEAGPRTEIWCKTYYRKVVDTIQNAASFLYRKIIESYDYILKQTSVTADEAGNMYTEYILKSVIYTVDRGSAFAKGISQLHLPEDSRVKRVLTSLNELKLYCFEKLLWSCDFIYDQYISAVDRLENVFLRNVCHPVTQYIYPVPHQVCETIGDLSESHQIINKGNYIERYKSYYDHNWVQGVKEPKLLYCNPKNLLQISFLRFVWNPIKNTLHLGANLKSIQDVPTCVENGKYELGFAVKLEWFCIGLVSGLVAKYLFSFFDKVYEEYELYQEIVATSDELSSDINDTVKDDVKEAIPRPDPDEIPEEAEEDATEEQS